MNLNINELLEKWPVWIGAILLFLPGILYQLQNKAVDLSSYPNTSIIIFLALAVYYSMPFIILGLIYVKIALTPGESGEDRFFTITLLACASYSLLYLISFQIQLLKFWLGYWCLFVLLMIILAIDSKLHKKRR